MMDSIPYSSKRRREMKVEVPVKKHVKKSSFAAVSTTSSTSAGSYIFDCIMDSVLESVYSTPAGSELKLDTNDLDQLRSNNIDYIKTLFQKKHIPSKQTVITAITECGYNNSIEYLLKSMADMLKNEIPNCTGAWCGYRPTDPNCPVFVVTLENPNCDFDMKRISKQFSDYDINKRFKNVPNNEEKTILEKTGEKITRGKDDTHVHTCIAQNTESLMREHSNLSIIRGSYARSRGYLKATHELVEEVCILFSVPVKGIVPIGEKEFTKSINGIPTDVREGEFILFARNMETLYHHKLCMGCCISRPETKMTGTLGGFVDLPDNKTGCLTAAHVVLTNDERNQYIKQVGNTGPLNDCLRNGQIIWPMYQPDAQEDMSFRCFGKVHSIAFDDGVTSVDAAIIEITKDDRKPDTGSFPEGNFSHMGFPNIEPMMFNNGNILDVPSLQQNLEVIKFGQTTGITRGRLGWDGISARLVAETGNDYFPTMQGQQEIESPAFANCGDSGALAFICYQDNLHAIGMVIGGNSTGTMTIITPISTIFQGLGLPNDRFKVFPPNVASNKGYKSHDNEYRHEHILGDHSEALNNILGKITTMENAVTRGFHEINQRFDNLAAILGNRDR